MLLCVMLNGPKKVGLPRKYQYTDCNKRCVDNNRCSLLIRDRVIGGSGLYDIRRKRSRDYAYGRRRLNEKNEMKKNIRNNNSLVWQRCSPCIDRGIRRLFHVPVWSRPINFGNTFRIESVSVPALNKNINILSDDDLSAMLY